MTSTPKLAIFDIDGTIASNSIISPEVKKGFTNLHNKGCKTSLSTGNGFVKTKLIFGDDFEKLISQDSLIIVEHGTKIVNPKGDLIFGDFFNESEIDHIIDFLRANLSLFRLVWFNPIDVSKECGC